MPGNEDTDLYCQEMSQKKKTSMSSEKEVKIRTMEGIHSQLNTSSN